MDIHFDWQACDSSVKICVSPTRWIDFVLRGPKKTLEFYGFQWSHANIHPSMSSSARYTSASSTAFALSKRGELWKVRNRLCIPKAPSLGKNSRHSSMWKVMHRQRQVWCMEKRLWSLTTVRCQTKPLKSLDMVDALKPDPSPLAKVRNRKRPSSYIPMARWPFWDIWSPMAGREPSSEKSTGLFCWIRASTWATDALRFLVPSPCASTPRSSSSPASSACSSLTFFNASSSNIFSNPETISHRAVMMPRLFAPLSKQSPIQSRGGTRKNSLIEGIEVKLPTIWTDEKQSRAEAERRERLEERRSEKRRVRRKKMQMREKVGKSRNTVFLRCFVAPEGRKVGSLKRRVRRHLGRWEMKSCTPLWREADFEVKRYKTPQCRTTFGSCDVEKVHAVVARSTFPSQNVQNTPLSDHFWKLRCRKRARRCGAKHISKKK